MANKQLTPLQRAIVIVERSADLALKRYNFAVKNEDWGGALAKESFYNGLIAGLNVMKLAQEDTENEKK